MKAEEIADLVRAIAPEELSRRLIDEHGEYDNTGLLVRGSDREIERVLVVLDADSDAVCEAEARGCGMIVSHHPVIYSPIKTLDFQNGQRNLIELIRSDVAVYSAHLSLDAAVRGINRTLAECLGLSELRPLIDLGEGCGLVFSGLCRESFESFVARVKSVTGGMLRVSENSKAFRDRKPGESGGDGSRPFRVAVANGGGADPRFLALAKSAGCGTFVSGDVRHHSFIWAKENGVNLIDAGHFETEQFYLKILTDALNEAAARAARGFESGIPGTKGGAGVVFLLSGQTAPYHTV